MEKRDYLLRQIEALRQILSRLRELIAGGATAEADSQIREEMRNVGLDLATANALDPATLLMLLGSPVLDARRAFTVATLLHMDAVRARADGDESRAPRAAVAARPPAGQRVPSFSVSWCLLVSSMRRAMP